MTERSCTSATAAQAGSRKVRLGRSVAAGLDLAVLRIFPSPTMIGVNWIEIGSFAGRREGLKPQRLALAGCPLALPGGSISFGVCDGGLLLQQCCSVSPLPGACAAEQKCIFVCVHSKAFQESMFLG